MLILQHIAVAAKALRLGPVLFSWALRGLVAPLLALLGHPCT